MRRFGLAHGALGALALILLASARASADLTGASAKAAVKVGDVSLVYGPQSSGESFGPWTTIMSTSIKTASGKDLIITPSLECGLYTNTQVSSKAGTSDTSSAHATIQIQVLIDGVPAQPGTVVFASRNQTLSATLQGLLNNSLSVDPVTGQVTINQALLTPEQVGLILDTMNAESFAFIQSVGVGMHSVVVQARIDLGVSFQAGSAVAEASLGKGSLTVETVRLVDKGAEIDF